MDAAMNVNDASDTMNLSTSEPSKPTELVDDSMDMDVDESNVKSICPYKIVKVLGRPDTTQGLEFDDNFEEAEAEMSSESDDEVEGEDAEVEGALKDISAAILLEKSIEETEDDADEDYIPTN